MNDRLVTSGPAPRFSAVWSWEVDGDGCICADLVGARTAMRLRDDERDSCGMRLYNDPYAAELSCLQQRG